MKRFRRFFGFLLPVLFVCLFSFKSQTVAFSDLKRSFELTYEVHLAPIPLGAVELKLWIPLAASDRHQKIRRRVIEAPVPYRVTRDPEYGNDILFLNLRRPLPAALDLSVRYETDVQGERVLADKVSSSSQSLAAAVMAFDKQMGLYLKSNRYMIINDDIRSLAQSITEGASSPEEKADRIYRYVIERMAYDKQIPGYGNGDTLRACAVGAGNCTDFHSLFISLARASGIPARFQIGLPVPEKAEGEIPGYHCWAQFYLNGVGWVPVDASEAWKHPEKQNYFFGTYDPNRLAVSNGRDVHLVPKSVDGPLNIFFFPHAEADGKTIEKEKIKTKFKFRDLAALKGENHA